MSAPVVSKSKDEKLLIYEVMLAPHEKNDKIMTLPVNAITGENKGTEVFVYFWISPQRLSKYKILDVKEDKDEKTKTIELERIESPKLKEVIKFHKEKEDTEQLFVRFYIPRPTKKELTDIMRKVHDSKLPDDVINEIFKYGGGKSKKQGGTRHRKNKRRVTRRKRFT